MENKEEQPVKPENLNDVVVPEDDEVLQKHLMKYWKMMRDKRSKENRDYNDKVEIRIK